MISDELQRFRELQQALHRIGDPLREFRGKLVPFEDLQERLKNAQERLGLGPQRAWPGPFWAQTKCCKPR